MKMKDEIKSTKEVVVENYQSIQAISFTHLDTRPSDWKMCKVKGAKESGAVFGVPKGYREVKAWSALNPTKGFLDSCELCGHPIKNLYPIQCDRLEIFMYVGSECVNNFSGAGYTHKMIVEYKETTLTKIFKAWRGIVIDEAWTNPECFDLHWKTNEPRELSPYSRDAKEGRKYQLKYEVYKFVEKLTKLQDFDILYPDEQQKERAKNNSWRYGFDVSELTSRKIANLFKKAKSLGLTIPDAIEPLIIPSKIAKKENDNELHDEK